MNISIELTIRELLHRCKDWDITCNTLGLNPWCLNEGLADENDTVTLTLKQYKKLIGDLPDENG